LEDNIIIPTKEKNSADVTEDYEQALKNKGKEKYVLRLYVTGMTAKSVRAIENVRKLCAKYLENRCDLEIIDVYQQPEHVKTEQLVAAPTLIKKLPLPLRKLIGDMSNKDRILIGLDLVPPEDDKESK